MTMSGCDTKTNPRIQLLPGGDWYNPMEKPHNFTVWLLDPKLHTMLRQHKCQTFSKSFSLQDSPFISFTTPTLHDFFKCHSTSRNAPNTTHKKNDHFAGYKIYNGCKDFSIYYKLSGDGDEDIRAGNFPANCSLIRLPIDTLAYDRDVFKMLSHVFLVQWELSYDCYQCHQGGGHCHTDQTNKFQCTDVNNPHAQDAKTTKSKLGVTLGAGLVMITLVVSFIWCYNEKKFSPSRFLTMKKCSDIFKHDVVGGSIYFGVPVFSYSELEEATNDFSSSRVLGDGGFGTIYYGERLPNPTALCFNCFFMYNGCKGFNIYYNLPGDDDEVFPAGNLTTNCSLLQLPIHPTVDGNFFTPGFLVEWKLSDDCNKCHYDGGQCRTDTTNKFYCQKDATTRRSMGMVLGTVFGGVGLLMITCLAVSFIWCYKERKFSSFRYLSAKKFSDIFKHDVEGGSKYFGVPVFSYSELEKATNDFSSSRVIGHGGFGTVYYGKLKDGREVFVKRLYEHNCKQMQQFVNEIEILTRLRHNNLVTLYGCTSRRSRELLLVYEYIPNGTLADHLHGDRAKNRSLTWPVRLNIAIETAGALAYLHASDIIHCDVKTNNILLDQNFSVKVG